jgi:hypothetical protein
MGVLEETPELRATDLFKWLIAHNHPFCEQFLELGLVPLSLSNSEMLNIIQ